MTAASPDPSFWAQRKVTVTGGGGFLGRPTVALLEDLGADVTVVRSADHDLRDRAVCFEALEGAQVVIHLAANVGGIGYNRRNPGPLAHDNLAMGLNVFEACRELGAEKLVAACSVCAYPKFTPVPFKEENIWDGYPEESNAPYGLAKKMLLVLSDSYRRQYGLDSCAPVMANLYGP
ncbi:MAG: NAD-dependent epimerase/dehydratase family protein, partial [Solirubrobacterales bacterium]